MRALDTRSLQIFAAVANCLSFRQAAEQLHLSQPPLSRAVRQLEQRLGVALFERDTQHVALTPAGAELLPQALHILALLDQAEAGLRQRQQAPRLRLGLTTSVDPGLYRAFTGALPQAQTQFAASPRLVAALRAHRLDAAVIALPCRSHELHVLPLGRQPLMVALSSRHALARRRLLSLADLGGQAVYWFERARQPAYFDHCHAVFRRHGWTPAFLREPLDHHVLLGDVAAGAGIALLPASFAALRRSGVAYRKLAEGGELALTLGLAVAEDYPAARLRELARLAEQALGTPS